MEYKDYTDEELTELCHHVVIDAFECVSDYVSHTKLKPHHIDIILTGKHEYDIEQVFRHCVNLTPEQIMFGLNHPDSFVRKYAAKNPCCTESQKVWYHLKYGDGDVDEEE